MCAAMTERPRIGVFVCNCGLNIAGSIDCEKVAEFASSLPNVVFTQTNRYTCSEPGQEDIKKCIKEHNLNRVVVAACTPRLHEPTFRATCKDGGLNPYLFEMANIREHCSWVHLYEKDAATEKAMDLVRMAVAKASLLEAEEEITVPVTKKTLVIGGGVAGIQASLDLADMGYKVYLVEKEPSIGGRMAQLDKTFPTMDCSICILAPKMVDAGRHPNIVLLTNAEVIDVKGYVGNFKVKVKKNARYVTKNCTACGECAKVCPIILPNEFDVGLASRKAIYTPFPQAVPSTYVIDRTACLNKKENILACDKCIKACEPNAIDFEMDDEIVDIEVGTIIIATGADVYDPAQLVEYGYTKYTNVITSLEFERLINAAGPSGGNLIRPSDMKIPKRVAFIQCIGSRNDKEKRPYCSNVCCMNTIKDALLIKEHWPDTEIFVFYIDIRAFGKGFEDLYKRAQREGVVFIRGIPAEVNEIENCNLRLKGENTLLRELYEIDTELVILSIGLEPRQDSDIVQKLFALSKTSDGFFLEAHPKLRPVDTANSGIFLAGCCESPKDIKDSVTQASASAARCNILMAKGFVKVEAITAVVNRDICKGCALCTKVCPYRAIQLDDTKKAFVIEAACAGCGTCGAECITDAIKMRHFTDEQIYAQIDAATLENADKKIIAFCCNWCSYAGADFAGVSRMQYPASVRIIRTMCSGRVKMKFIEKAFAQGAAAVLVAGCHLGDCHYINANYQTQKRIEKFHKKLEKAGINKERLQLAWISAAEGAQFADRIKKLDSLVKQLPKSEIEKTVEIFSQRAAQAKK
jgi:heterodisulfide reductase subunit A